MTAYILPGMGADSSMYGKAFLNLETVRYLNWPNYNNEQSIPEVSKRIIEDYKIQPNDIVGGSSLAASYLLRCTILPRNKDGDLYDRSPLWLHGVKIN